MKIKSKKGALLLLATGACVAGLVGCKSTAKIPINFVAVSANEWNTTVQYGDYNYKFSGRFSGSDVFTLQATAVERVAPNTGGGGGGSKMAINPKAALVAGESEGGSKSEGQGGKDESGQESQEQGQQGGDDGSKSEEQGQEQGSEQQGGKDQGSGEQGGQQGGEQGGQQQSAAVTSVSFSVDKNWVYINEGLDAKVTVFPQEASQDVNWSSDNEEIATVSTAGKIVGKSVGKAVITATSKSDASKKASLEIEVKEENLAEQNWNLKGTYKEEPGYGYVLNLEDEGKTCIHVDYNKTEGRHEFYYNLKHGETTNQILFQAKDPKYGTSLAKDYKTWDVRDAKYIFCARATGNNGSAATAYLYFHNSDDNVVKNAPKSGSASREMTYGMKYTEANGVITLIDGNNKYTSVNSINPEHPAKKISVGTSTFVMSENPDIRWKKITAADFDGKSIYTFTGTFTESGPGGGTKELSLYFSEGGKAHLYSNGFDSEAEGEWSENGGKLSLTLNNTPYEIQEDSTGRYVTYKYAGSKSTTDVRLSEVK